MMCTCKHNLLYAPTLATRPEARLRKIKKKELRAQNSSQENYLSGAKNNKRELIYSVLVFN